MGGPGGRSPHGGGLGGCPPQNFRRGGELLPFATPPRVGPKTPANPKPTRVGKTGVQGGKAPWQGVWGMCPQKFKRGGELPTFANPPTSGTQNAGKP